MKFIVIYDQILTILINVKDIKFIIRHGQNYTITLFSGDTYKTSSAIPEDLFEEEDLMNFLKNSNEKIFKII